MAKLLTTLLLDPFMNLGLDFIGLVKLMGRHIGNKYLHVVINYTTNGWKQKCYTPT
jgi:hypothetical protein